MLKALVDRQLHGKLRPLSLAIALLLGALVGSSQLVSMIAAQEEDDGGSEIILQLSFAPFKVEVGQAKYSVGYVQLVSGTGLPTLASRNTEVELESRNSTVASVPPVVVIPEGSDYAKFALNVGNVEGETEISALLGDQIVNKDFEVVAARSLIPENIDLVLNFPSDKMQIGSEMPVSVYLEKDGAIIQSPQDIAVSFDYDRSLIKLSDNEVVIQKGSYYGLTTARTLEKSGTAFLKASTSNPPVNTVENIQISSTQPTSLQIHVFPSVIGPNEKTIDIFVSLLDATDSPTLAAEDVEIELFANSSRVTNIGDVNPEIKKGEFGYYLRQSINFINSQTVTVGATSSGLGVATTTFEVVDENMNFNSGRAADKTINVYTLDQMPSDASAIAVYQISTIETDEDDTDFNADGVIDEEDQDVDDDGEFDTFRDFSRDGVIDEGDDHAIDDLDEGELYPIQSSGLYSRAQENLHVVSGDNAVAAIVNTGSVVPGSSYGTAIITSGRIGGSADISVSLDNAGAGTNSTTVVGGLNPTQTVLFSPAGFDLDGNPRIAFNEQGISDLMIITLDSSNRPAGSAQGVQYLVRPINDLAEIEPGKSFANIVIQDNAFGALKEGSTGTVTVVPVGAGADPTLQTESDFDLISFTGTTGQVMFPFESTVGFSRINPVGAIQLTDSFGNPILASSNLSVRLSSSNAGVIQVPATVTIAQDRSFAEFPLTMSGKLGNTTITATAESVRSSSAAFRSVLADLPGSFVDIGSMVATKGGNITVSTAEGTSVLWGAHSSMQIVAKDEKAFIPDPESSLYLANLQVIPNRAGNFTIDVTLLKDGFKSKKISDFVFVEPYLNPLTLNVFYPLTTIPYNEPTTIDFSVEDENGDLVEGVVIRVTPGKNATADPVLTSSDENGGGSFVYTFSGNDLKTPIKIDASKDGYRQTSKTLELEVTDLPTALPPWVTYVAIAGVVASIGGGVVYFMKKPKGKRFDEETEEEEEEL